MVRDMKGAYCWEGIPFAKCWGCLLRGRGCTETVQESVVPTQGHCSESQGVALYPQTYILHPFLRGALAGFQYPARCGRGHGSTVGGCHRCAYRPSKQNAMYLHCQQ